MWKFAVAHLTAILQFLFAVIFEKARLLYHGKWSNSINGKAIAWANIYICIDLNMFKINVYLNVKTGMKQAISY